MRKEPFVSGEYYHIYNRGVDKRQVFADKYDLERFFQSMIEFNRTDAIGSIYENSFRKAKQPLGRGTSKLVEFVAFCLNPNHYHFILKQIEEKGIENFMKKLGNGYTKYFNHRHNRSGVLFQGAFKSVHIKTNEQLLYVSVYVNLNYLVHGVEEKGLFKSSFNEYLDSKKGLCNPTIILDQFKKGPEIYSEFAMDALRAIREKKDDRRKNIDFLE